jgi:multicomponent Na+:H+ antiporter subunit D
MGMIGMMPLNTFWGKFYLMKGSVAGGKWPFALVLIVSGIINAVCFIPTVVNAFSGEKVQSNAEREGRVALMLTPTMVLASIGLFIGIYPGIIWSGVQAVVNCFY